MKTELTPEEMEEAVLKSLQNFGPPENAWLNGEQIIKEGKWTAIGKAVMRWFGKKNED